MSLLIKNALALTPDGILEHACILTENGVITSIDTAEHTADEVIDARGGIAMPALVNAHTHLAMTYFRSYATDLPLMKWLDKIYVIEDRMTDEDIYCGTLLACAEAMESGTALVNDMYLAGECVVRACRDSGIRACVARTVVDTDGEAGLHRRLDENRAMHECEGGLVKVIAAAHAEYTCSPKALEQVYALAREWNVPVHIHISETAEEVAACMERHGTTPIGLLESMGLLETPTIAAHCVHVNNSDIRIMQKRGVYPVNNPLSNLKLASGIAPVPKMLSVGVPVALGTDGCGSNNNLDMFREMTAAALIQKGYQLNAEALTAKQTVNMATKNGARILGTTGELKPGAEADITVLKSSLLLEPVHDVYGIVTYSAESRDVNYTIINGKVTVKDGKCVTVDTDRLRAEFSARTKRLFEL